MESLLTNPQFQENLRQIADQQQESLEKVTEEAATYLKEMYTVHRPLASVIGTQTAQYILSRGYQKTIDVNPTEIKRLTKLARRHPIAFVMTHKTYIDMLVLAVVLARHGLPLPYTFAGINMNFLGLGQFGRQAGVIFIRRSFKDNLVYKATLRHFIAHLVQENAHFMWAIEGTRSRTGKLVWPKMGILKYIKDAEVDTGQEVKYVPVSIVYDLIPDVKEMTQEGRGQTKSPESLGWFLNYIKKMGDNFGKISLRLGDPVELSTNPIAPEPKSREQFMSANGLIPRFALGLVHRINQITPVTTASLVCIALLGKYALSKRAIESDLADLMQLIESHKPDALVDRGKPIGESVQAALNLLRRAELVVQQGEDLNAKYVIASENYLSTTYYANMAAHHLYHRAFIELALVKIVDLEPQERSVAFWSEIMRLRDLFKFEFFYSRKARFSDEIEANLDYIDPDWAINIQTAETDPQQLLDQQKVLVAPVVLHTYVEAYTVVAHALQNWDAHRPFDEEAFINNCLYLGEEMQWQGRIQRIESVSKPFLVNGLRLVKNLQLLPSPEADKTAALEQFIAHLREVSQRINHLQGITLAKPYEHAPQVPLERDIVPGSTTESITHEIIDDESGPHIGAFFDLDRTLIKGFSAKEFFQTRVLSGRITTREVVAQFAGVIVYAMGNGNFAGLAAVGAKGVKGVKEQLFLQVGEEVYQKHLAEEIYPESRALVAAHMAKGHTVAIISAATPYQVNPIARDLGIEHVMCTRMEVENGVFTGNIIEPACWGEGKAHAAQELTERFQLDLSKSYFYTDSAEDLPLLEIVGKPRPLNPDTKLSAIAFQNDWPIFRFNDEDRPGMSNWVRTGLAISSLIPAVINGVATGARNLSWQEGVNSLMATVGDLVTSVAGIELVVKGEEHLWSHRPAVFIFNHQSNVDLFIASKLIRRDAVGIAKKELKNMPVIGQLMTAAGVIFLDRKNREKAIEAMKPAVDALKSGTSIIIFPEGTRSYDYQLGPFKKGAFHLAMQAGVPLIPIIIKNAHDAMPRGTNLFRPTAIEVIVAPPISTADWDLPQLNERIDKVRQLFLRELGQGDPSIDAVLNNNHKSEV
ncbi:MAG: HAD-IB family hydrolase [Bacteroidota bacterium]